jgi:hypothetical protein
VSLLDLEELLATGADGHRLVDDVAERLAIGDMPPPGTPRPPREDMELVARWASCGATGATTREGLTSSARPFVSPDRAPMGTTSYELLADAHVVTPETRDAYVCFVSDLDVPTDQFVRRFEMVFDETRVLHHLILSRDTMRLTTPGVFDCNGGTGLVAGSEYLYTWAPGQSALEFPEGGLRVRPGDRFIMQIHYNNGLGLPDVVDDSGVRLHLAAPEGPEYGMVAFGPTDFRLPARRRTTVEGRCVLPTAMNVLAGMPHMHELGSAFEHSLVRGGESSPLLTLSGWSFESQIFYALPVAFRAGDVIETRCTYENTTDEAVVFGERTVDEMCNDYVYVTPPPPSLYCDEGNPDRPRDVEYERGECADVAGPTDAPLARGGWTMTAERPSFALAAVPEGSWEIEGVEIYGTGGETPVGAIDFEASYALARGRVVTSASSLTFDVTTDTVVLLEAGMRFGSPMHQSFTVPFDATTSPVESAPSCPAGAAPASFVWGLDGELLTIGLERRDVPGMTIWPTYHFRRVP